MYVVQEKTPLFKELWNLRVCTENNIEFIQGNFLILCMENEFSEKNELFQDTFRIGPFFNTRSGLSSLFTFEIASFPRTCSVAGY